MTPFQDDKWLSAVELTLHTMVGEGHRFCWTLQVTCVSTPTVPAAVTASPILQAANMNVPAPPGSMRRVGTF